MDTLFITDLRLKLIVGTRPLERKKPQTILIGVKMTCDLSKAGRTDRLADTINYNDLAKKIRARFHDACTCLIEKIADETARICLTDPRVKSVTVSVVKPAALPFARNAGVCITRRRIRQ